MKTISRTHIQRLIDHANSLRATDTTGSSRAQRAAKILQFPDGEFIWARKRSAVAKVCQGGCAAADEHIHAFPCRGDIESHRDRATNLRLVRRDRGEDRGRVPAGNPWRNAAVAVVIGCILSACGGGGSSSQSDPTPAAPAQQSIVKSVSIYADGDSTMFGWSVLPTGTVQSSDNQPATIQADMRTVFGDVVTVENHAVGGTTVLDSINGTNGFTQPLGVRLAASDAQIVIGNFEINDQYRMTPAQFGQGWQTWINTVKSLGKTPVIIEPNPICRADAPNVGPYLDAERAVAAANNVMLVAQHDYIYGLSNWQAMLTDCVHPSDELYKVMGDRDATAMALIVQTLLK